MGKIIAISISSKKGVKKENVEKALLIESFGIKNDAHAGNWHRQVSLLDVSSINYMKEKLPDIKPGDFAENITTEGIKLSKLSVGTFLKVGDDCFLEITQIGKKCENKCNIYYTVGDCIMPREGIFAKVIKGGEIKVGDKIEVINNVKSCNTYNK